jgi:fructose-bisphosphate aldolase, class I
MFLSGGQSGDEASSRLNAMQVRHGLMSRTTAADAATTRQPLPWPLSFSFAHALQHPALEIWSGQEMNRVAAQLALIQRAQRNSAALKGQHISDASQPKLL